MSDNVIQTSFASGELSPSIFARTDLTKYKTGAARMRNMFVDYRSGASTRAGTKFLNWARYSNTSTRLIPFQFSTTAAFAIEFGDAYCRFFQNGAAVLESGFVVSAISKNVPMQVTAVGHNYALGDTVFIQGAAGMVQANNRYYVISGIVGDVLSLSEQNSGDPINSTNYTTYTSGGVISRVYTISSPYAAADLPLLKFVQNANVMTFVHTAYTPYTLTATAFNSWAFTQIQFGTSIAAPTGLASSATGAGTANFSYVVTAVDNSDEESPQSLALAVLSAVNITTTAGTITVSWNASVNAVSYNVYRAQLSITNAVPVGQAYGFQGSVVGTNFIDSNVVPDFSQTPPIIQNPFVPGQINLINVTAQGSGYTQATVGYIINTTTGSGASFQPVVSGGKVTAFIILNHGQGYAPGDTITVTDSAGGAGATVSITLGPASGMNPGCVCYFQQRAYYAGSIQFPMTFWASQPGNFNNFNVSDPIIDSDSITGTLVSLQVNAIKSMIPMPGGLILLTSQGAWQLSSGAGLASTSAVTPANATANPQAYNGASDVPPIVINYDILYVQSKGSIVRDLSYNIYANIYTGADISVLSNHLFFGYQILEWAYSEEPFKIVWAVRDDGILLSLTYVKEQEIFGWARHDTLGLVKSVCVVREGNVDAVYLTVSRHIGGQWVTAVERMANREFIYGAEDSFCVDCGVSSSLPEPATGIAASTSTGTVVFTINDPFFSSGNVGQILRMGGGIATITTFISSTQLEGVWTQDPTIIVPNDPNNTPVPAEAGEWTLSNPATVFYGLDYLEGQTVSILADGGVISPQVVTNGSITLSQPATKVHVGLKYVAQLQTMPLDIGEPTIQGKRKKINSLTVRCANTRGLKFGRIFDTMYPIKEMTPSIPLGQPIPLLTGDSYITMDPLWDVPGQICLQQDDPLPATVLGVVPEITIGDTGSGRR